MEVPGTITSPISVMNLDSCCFLLSPHGIIRTRGRVMSNTLEARLTPTFATRRSSERSTLRLVFRQSGSVPSFMPTNATALNSKPFATWMVSTRTPGPSMTLLPPSAMSPSNAPTERVPGVV